ncbi:MAG: DNA translocase FtsK [Dethiobacter sp.]|jgi:S-DNA-T family DNA segregation ATPase FtsK/SpoIIIE|nr:DNA translocase FtsK [Dethiobacter sp.]
MASYEIRDEIRQQIKAVILLAMAALCFAALNLTSQTGEVGLFFNNVLRVLTGDLAIVVPLILVTLALQQILPNKISNMRQRVYGVLLFLLILLVGAHLKLMENRIDLIIQQGVYRASLTLGYSQQGGGVTGAVVSMLLYFLFREIGSKIIILALVLISFLLVTNYSFTQLFQTALSIILFGCRSAVKFLKATFRFASFLFSSYDSGDEPTVTENTGRIKKDNGINISMPQKTSEANIEQAAAFYHPQPVTTVTPKSVKQPESIDNTLIQKLKDKPSHISFISLDHADYTLPPLTLLSRIPRLRDTQQQKTIAERARILEKTLDSFGVKVKVSDVQSGPTVTRYEIQPETGVKVSKIVALADDLALNLAAPGVRIEAPIPGKAAVGIEVPNKVIAPVYLREVLEDEQFKQSSSPLAVGLGKDITGIPVLADLVSMPHLLIAGSTGSGKSVCINTVIASILFKATPDEVKFVLIDPKVVELTTFNGIPHLLMPVVTEPKKASLALKNMVKEMGRRYELFARESVREISRFNERMRLQNQEHEMLPYIVVIIDELADLMMVAAADVEDSIARLAQMSRAAGIHLVIATQRPSVDVITGVIKANITSRVAFAVSSHADSRTILDMGGAEKLLGRGDMLFHPLGISKPFRVQGAFINDRELNELLEFIKGQGEPKYQEQLLNDDEGEEEWYEEDDLFPQAVMLIAEAETASISLLQRRLRIGYTRAARLIDDMERRGFVGRFEGSKAREVLITPDQATKLLFDRDVH